METRPSSATIRAVILAASAFIALVFTVDGCGGVALRSDAVPPAVESGYPTAEFVACGALWHGLGVCQIQEGADLSSIALSIQGYYQGTIRVATTCRSDSVPDDSFRYQNSLRAPYFLSGKASSSCGVSFIVSPEYPDQDTSQLKISSFIGHLYVRVVPAGQLWLGFTGKAVSLPGPPTQANDVMVSLPAGDIATAEVAVDSNLCGAKFDKVMPVVSGVVKLALSDILPTIPLQTCVMNGVIFAKDAPVRFSWFIAGYSSSFVPLPIPALSFPKPTKLHVDSDANTSVVALDGAWAIDRQADFDFDATKVHVLRLLTVGGRSLIGYYSPQSTINGGWTWLY